MFTLSGKKKPEPEPTVPDPEWWEIPKDFSAEEVAIWSESAADDIMQMLPETRTDHRVRTIMVDYLRELAAVPCPDDTFRRYVFISDPRYPGAVCSVDLVDAGVVPNEGSSGYQIRRLLEHLMHVDALSQEWCTFTDGLEVVSYGENLPGDIRADGLMRFATFDAGDETGPGATQVAAAVQGAWRTSHPEYGHLYVVGTVLTDMVPLAALAFRGLASLLRDPATLTGE